MKIMQMFDWLKPASAVELAEQQIEETYLHVEALVANASHHRELAETFQRAADNLRRPLSFHMEMVDGPSALDAHFIQTRK